MGAGLSGQHLFRAVLAITEVGGDLPRRDQRRHPSPARGQGLDDLLQHQAAPFRA